MSSAATRTDLKFRAVTPADLEQILQHRRQMFHDMGHSDTALLDEIVRSSRPVIEQLLKNGSYRGWFAVAPDGAVAAGAGLVITPWPSGPLNPALGQRAYLLNVYTDPEFRKRGLARALTQVAIAYCRKQGHKILWLHASKYGRPLYEALGFETTNEMKLIL